MFELHCPLLSYSLRFEELHVSKLPYSNLKVYSLHLSQNPHLLISLKMSNDGDIISVTTQTFWEILPLTASCVIETGLYGLLLILAPLTLYTLWRRPEQSSLSSSTFMDKIVIVVCAVQFCATTVVRSYPLTSGYSIDNSRSTGY